MSVSTFTQLENNIHQLSLREQLRLLEVLVRAIRQHTFVEPDIQEDELDRMAVDPNIQREIRDIEAEFAVTEADGLGTI
ncbi:MAG: hypothetical protein AAF702_17935 [Chloroflexota bacterium]